MDEVRLTLKNILLLLLSLLFCLVFCEVILRIFYPQNLNFMEYDEVTKFKGRSNMEMTFRHEDFVNNIKLNSEGLRDKEYGEKGDKYRILALGDSFTFGVGVEGNETYPKILEGLLGNKYEVINAGFTMWGTDQEIAFLETEGLNYNPDMVILGFFIGNDVYNNNKREDIFSVQDGNLITEYPSYYFSRLSYLKSWSSSKSHTYRLCSKIKWGIASIIKEKEIEPEESVVDYDSDFEKTFLLLDRLKTSLDGENILLLIIIIPTKEQVGLRSNYDKSSFTDYLDRKNINYIDLLPYLIESDKSLFYYRDEHFNQEGHKLAAKLIYEGGIK